MEQMDKRPPFGSIEAKDPFAAAPAGHSLTIDNTQWPWGKPPKQVDPSEVLKKAIGSLETRKVKQEMMKLLAVGVSVETLVEGYILQAFHEGSFLPDVGLLIKGPLAMYIANMAEEEGIPYRFFENADELEEGEMDDETFFSMMQQNNPAMFEYVSETVNRGIREGNAPQPIKEDSFMNMKKDK